MKSSNSTNLLLILLSSLIFTNFTCNDCEEELHDQKNYSIMVLPQQIIYEIGDTIIVSANFSSQIELELSNQIHDNTDQLANFNIEIFQGIESNVDAIQARDDFEIIDITGNTLIPLRRTWEIQVENTCNENLCELVFGIIPRNVGYFGISQKLGRFGYENECQNFTLIPSEIESNEDNNFEIFNEINISRIRINRSYYANPETENSLYFFRVI